MAAASSRAYLDWNASAPLRPEARDALVEALERFGNPSSVHAEGREARNLVEASREGVAEFLGCGPSEVVFTSGGTEANNLAVRLLAALPLGPKRRSFAAARLEHASVLRPLEALERAGWDARWLPVDGDGRARVEGFPDDAAFACLQAANHETGAVQPLEELGRRCAERGIPWHCDAVQAWGRLALRAGELGCTTAALSGHKLGAPKGVGALYVRAGTLVDPLLRGGPQERGRRAGTENAAGIAALAAACAAAARDREADARWTSGLRDELWNGVRQVHPLAVLNGPEAPALRLPNTVNITFPGLEAVLVVQALDLEGAAVSSGSACASGAEEPSEVLRAMGLAEWRVTGAVRVSVGPTTQPDDVDRFLEALRTVVARMRVTDVPLAGV